MWSSLQVEEWLDAIPSPCMCSSLQVEEWLNSVGVGLEDADQIIQLP